MKTTSIYLQTLSAPCGCNCRYCLLSWNHEVIGAEYGRSERYAQRFQAWLTENRPELDFQFYFGYSMEQQNLFKTIDTLNQMGCSAGKMLQMDGMKFRSEPERLELMRGLAAHGVQQVNFTFYGLQEYHDKFAGRPGDFIHMIGLVDAAVSSGLEVSAGIPLNAENADSADTLLTFLKAHGVGRISMFVPHEEGRGIALHKVRFSVADYERLGEQAKALFRRDVYRTEAEWVGKKEFAPWENRALIISLTKDNIEQFEQISFEGAIAYVEELDEEYYRVIPTVEELADRYGDKNGTCFYQQRDLYQHYQRIYRKEQGLSVYDVTDERQCGSRRY